MRFRLGMDGAAEEEIRNAMVKCWPYACAYRAHRVGWSEKVREKTEASISPELHVRREEDAY